MQQQAPGIAPARGAAAPPALSLPSRCCCALLLSMPLSLVLPLLPPSCCCAATREVLS